MCHKKTLEVQQEIIDQYFFQELPLTVQSVIVLDYLGIAIAYYIHGKFQVTISDYINTLLEDLPKPLMEKSSTPVFHYLFDMYNDNDTLDKPEDGVYYHYVIHLLHLCKRISPDPQPPISFLLASIQVLNKYD